MKKIVKDALVLFAITLVAGNSSWCCISDNT